MEGILRTVGRWLRHQLGRIGAEVFVAPRYAGERTRRRTRRIEAALARAAERESSGVRA
jgi:hypothetical protein